MGVATHPVEVFFVEPTIRGHSRRVPGSHITNLQ